MALVFGEQVAWEQVENLSAVGAAQSLDPYEVLDMGLVGAALYACRAIERSYQALEPGAKATGCFSVCLHIEMLYLLAHDPVGHGVDVVAKH
ncbi:MAG TPA: hypothetical protein PLB78_05175, partial [Anaerolineae bacterium]|nr:hypothetical protein [Anaerolineae bacterium]